MRTPPDGGPRGRRLRRVDLAPFDPGQHSERLHGWLCQPHVARWWGDPRQAMEHAMQGAPESHALIVADGRPVGYLCWQKPPRQELQAANLTDLPEALVDIDILIGEPALLGRGVGSRALLALLARFRRGTPVLYAGVGTSISNERALRAFARAGFRPFREFQDPEWGPCRYLLAEVHRTVSPAR